MTNDVYLEMTFRHGKAFAGYLHLPRQDGDHVDHSRPVGDGLVIDYTEDGRVIGVEITAPSVVGRDRLRALLADLHVESVAEEDLAPLLQS